MYTANVYIDIPKSINDAVPLLKQWCDETVKSVSEGNYIPISRRCFDFKCNFNMYCLIDNIKRDIYVKGLNDIYKKSFENMMFGKEQTVGRDIHILEERMKDLFIPDIGYVKYKFDVNILISDNLFAEVNFKTN